MASDGKVVQSERVMVGWCPNCRRVVVVLNNYEVWPLVDCACGAQYPTTLLIGAVRYCRDEIHGVDLGNETRAG